MPNASTGPQSPDRDDSVCASKSTPNASQSTKHKRRPPRFIESRKDQPQPCARGTFNVQHVRSPVLQNQTSAPPPLSTSTTLPLAAVFGAGEHVEPAQAQHGASLARGG